MPETQRTRRTKLARKELFVISLVGAWAAGHLLSLTETAAIAAIVSAAIKIAVLLVE